MVNLMGHRGPPKTPTTLKVMRGIPGGKHKLTPNEPQPEVTSGAKPVVTLSPEAQEVWDRIVPQLEELKLLTKVDVNALTRYCDAFARWIKARDFLQEKGDVYAIYHEQTPQEKKEGKKKLLKYMAQFPQVSIYATLSKELTRFEQQFGLTPAARAGLSIRPPNDTPNDRLKLYGIK